MRILPVLFLLFSTSLCGQTRMPGVPPEYYALVDSAYLMMYKGECGPCLDLYEQAFAISQHSALSYLRAARCAQQCDREDKTLELANRAVQIDWSRAESILDDAQRYPELQTLAESLAGAQIRATIQTVAAAAGIDLGLMHRLEKIQKDDQWYRTHMDSIRAIYTQDAPEYMQYMEAWMAMDSLNMLKIDSIIARYGYPGKSMVGETFASTAWLVIQHAPLEKQEYYLPMITEAAENGEIPKSNLALLTDRIRVRKDQPQLYGSQVHCDPDCRFYPIEDEAHVNERRAAIGMGPLEDYARHFGFEWAPPKG